MSYQIDSLFGSAADKAEATGTITPSAKAAGELPPEHDLAYARAAVAELLNRGAKDTSLPWENPQTGARGTVTPLATAYDRDGHQCQDFLASYVRGATESWLRGEACREHKGRWAVHTLTPWKRS
jgi:surface antigen